ncbi:potassium transporter TrkG [Ignisphaera sp. 4213-co]|uniref:Potassium transporter TrkG n=1 Tax=Ignisphaera cupida TaxID=3050454 RepID=A0ABD4Z5X4_9CREN|nr:potassium transporter TrkG [Ignisphaera sp. 4213-co]MDK6028706.1 potassium transporter TrkG [Ignisphaera sp. 4213-co]
MRRFFAIVSTVSQINLALMVVALINGLAFLIYYVVAGDVKGYATTINYLKATIVLAMLWSVLTYALREYIIESPIDAMIVTAFVWLTVPFSSSVIYNIAIGMNSLDSFFESISGFSGTGLTVIANLESIPYVVLTWRAITQWLGELGTVVVAGIVLPFLHASLLKVYSIERGPKFASTIRRSVVGLFTMYLAYTLLGSFLLVVSGMSFIDALTHSMTAIATGGMSTKTENIGYWYFRRNSMILVTTSIVMIIGALNFRDLKMLSTGNLKGFAKSSEVRGFFAILLALIVTTVIASIVLNIGNDIAVLIYHVISGYTTTGFQVGDIKSYPTILKAILIISMAIGGATFSTAGGIKTRRAVIALKSILWDIERAVLPREYRVVKRIGEEVLDDEIVASTITYIIIYILFQILLSTSLYLCLVINNIKEFDYIDAMFEVTSALSCVGLSVNITSPTLPILAKVILIMAMYLGRLEFLPLYLLLGYYYRRKALL